MPHDDPEEFARTVQSTSLQDFEDARRRISQNASRSPLLPLQEQGDDREIRLKAEMLQPGGSFKIRCATNILEQLDDEELAGGVVTASAGNFAPALALAAKSRQVRMTCHAPEATAKVKLDALHRLGVRVVSHPTQDWWSIMQTRDTDPHEGLFIHPASEIDGIIGNGSLGLELREEWPEIDTVVVPIGGGGLASGIACALRAADAGVRVIACEIDVAAPIAGAFAAGGPVPVARRATIANSQGEQTALKAMWPLLRDVVDDVITVTETEAGSAFQRLALSEHLIVEAQSAIALAAALSPRCGGAKVAVVLSGGNIDQSAVLDILGREIS